MTLEEAKKAIKEPDQQAMELCKRRLGQHRQTASQSWKAGGQSGENRRYYRKRRIHLEKKALVTMCADNGVVEEGVTQTGQEVTAIVTDNFLNKKATASILCSMAGADIFPVDIRRGGRDSRHRPEDRLGHEEHDQRPGYDPRGGPAGSGDRYFHGGRTEK